MLQTNFGGPPIQMTVFNPSSPSNQSIKDYSKTTGTEPAIAPCPKTGLLIELFEEVTGWKIEFAESNTSLQLRKLSTSKAETAQGTFSIVDMSENWPPQKPTCPRGKCDQIVAVINDLVADLHAAQSELGKTQSALVALDPTADIDEELLVDSFVPKFGLVTKSEIEISDSDAQGVTDEYDDDFEVHQDVWDFSAAPVCPPFDGWSLGGATGIVGNYYLDWMVNGEECISICVGEIDTEAGDDRESVILVDPLTNEFRVVPSGRLCDQLQDWQAFHLWDSSTRSLSAINPSNSWQRLKSHQAIVATTASKVGQIECWQSAFETHVEKSTDHGSNDIVFMAGSDKTESVTTVSAKPVLASRLADMLVQTIGTSEPLLVLKRD